MPTTPDDPLDYHAMVERALRGVLRETLELAAEEGLPGDHHFFVSFETRAPDATADVVNLGELRKKE